ncbi:anaphase-promoting complex subunit 2-like [Daphnia pulex]|uniref:anaphase-promoting complex subunit 2-like n=1 Tax=Daphnia pulex TaxID=6669 RepID=UPI001EDF24C4|nr:anaphase-promoting complex subunit 2-like [Daphnia pulex]
MNTVKPVSSAWDYLKQTLNLDGKCQKELDRTEIEGCAEFIVNHDLVDFSKELVWQKLFNDTRNRITPNFWSRFEVTQNENSGYENYREAVKVLNTDIKSLQHYFSLLDHLSGNVTPKSFAQYQAHLSAILLSQIPPKFECCVNFFYSRAFRAFMSLEKRNFNFDGDESGDVITHCSGCDQEIDQCECNVILDNCHNTNKALAEIGILEKLSVGMIHTLILTQIQSHVQDSCVGNFSSSQIEMLEKWLQNIIFRWLGIVYGEDYIQQDQVRKNFTQFLYHAYTHARIEQLFEIIIGYPESFPSVKDLQECLSRTQLKPILAQSLKTTLEARLLHQGATTEDILIAYVSAIRAFSVLDPTGVLLDVACDPIKQYLRLRGDTVRHIIHSLTDSSGELGGELELGRTGTAILDEESVAAVGDTEASTDWENWLPAPSDADPSKLWTGKKPGDIVPMLVNIYGSKSLFVKEYRKLLSDRLLLNLHFDTEEEIRNLEFLKIRFGENELHNCEVMLKDVADSKRINTHLQSVVHKPEFPISAMIISAQYWDQLKDKPMKLPIKIINQLEQYNQNYKTVKTSRSLHWVPQSGSVELELEFDNHRCVSFTVPPDLAAIISHFEDKDQWDLEELSQEMELPMSHLRRRVHVWQTHGVLQEISTDRFKVDENGPNFTGHKILLETLAKMEEEEEDDDEEDSEKKTEEDGLQVYWSYVVGMLTNLEALPVERIHQMLKMFTMQGSSGAECTLQQLKNFLDSKVKQQLLSFSSGMYRLPKP